MKRILELFVFRRVATWSLAALAIISFWGVVVPQGLPYAYYRGHYPPWLADLIFVLNLDHVFRTWYFAAAAALLALAVAVCAFRRFPLWIAPFTGGRPAPAKPDDLECAVAVGPAGPGSLERARAALGGRWRDAGDGWYNRRRPWAAWGQLLVHAGVLLFLVAAAFSSRGRRDDVFIFENQAIILPPAYGSALTLAVDETKEQRDANTGEVTGRYSRLRLLRGNTTLAARTVEVNEPLIYGGLNISQRDAEGGTKPGLWLEVVKVREGVRLPDFGRATFVWDVGGQGGETVLAPGTRAPLGNTGFVLTYVDYYERFQFVGDGFNDEGAAFNPAAIISVTNAKGDAALAALLWRDPGRSSVTAADPAFSARPVTVGIRGTAAPFIASRRDVVFASGSVLPAGGAGDTMKVEMAPGEGTDLRLRILNGEVFRKDGRKTLVRFPYGVRRSLALSDGVYFVRYMGSKEAPVAALAVSRDPGRRWFGAASVVLVLALAGSLFLRYDERWLAERGGRLFLAARSSGGDAALRPDFDAWVASLRRVCE